MLWENYEPGGLPGISIAWRHFSEKCAKYRLDPVRPAGQAGPAAGDLRAVLQQHIPRPEDRRPVLQLKHPIGDAVAIAVADQQAGGREVIERLLPAAQ